jgi:NADPH:quinone reductase-like Zn-dependent oxidoreductase/SAM-dependent methyltransferase
LIRYCADLLTRECALRLAYYRGLFTTKVQDQCTFIGAMLAVGLSAENAAKYFNKVDSGFTILPDGLRLTISCINSPRSTTVSGEISQIQGLKRVLDHEGIFNRQLRVPVAYHSRQMELIASDCLEKIGHLQSPKQTGSAKMISSVTGELLTKERACEGSYWVANLVSPVLFSKAMERLCRDSVRTPRKKLNGSHRDVFGIDHIIEIGPHAALRLPIQEILETHSRKDEIRYFSALYRRKSASISLLSVLGELHCRGLSVDLRIINDPDLLLRDSRKSLIDAPKYPFDHSIRYWSESPLIRNYRTRAHGYTELLGSPSRDWNPLEPQWRCCVQTADMPWLLEHKLSGRAIYPASAFIVMAMQGVAQIKKDKQRISGFTLRDVRYDSSIEVSLGCKDLETRLQLRPADWTIKTKNSPWTFTVFSVTAGNWKESCHGTIEAHFEAGSTTTSEVERSEKHRDCAQERNNRCNMQFDASVVYQNFAKCGFQYGPMFQGITKVCHDGADTVTADVILQSFHKNPYSSDLFLIHPATLDSFFQVALVALSQGDKCIPTQAISGIEKLWLSATNLQSAHQNIKASARVDVDTPRHKRYSGFALCHGGENIRIVLDGLKTTVVSSAQQTERLPNDCQFWYKIQTNVDIETLSRSQILRRFDSMCGSDPSGPSGFFHDLRLYLRAMIGDLHGQFQNMDPDLSKPHLMRYIGWMKWHLDNSTLEPCSLSDGTLRSRVADQGFLGQFFLKVADSAFDVLKGKADMMQLLFEDNLVETFYEQQLAESVYYRKCQQYLEDLSFKYPSMDYLEIGAGTGSFTEHILKALSSSTTGAEERFNSYCFTDISTAFFERARQRFSAHTHKMKFTVLDADRDPVFQRFREHSFDVVCASNVLHVTKNLDLTLQRIRKLLKTGGKIILHEYIRPENIEVGFVFGLLPGWWPPTDGSRTMSPLITETSWDVLLRRNGFSGIDFALRDFADEDSHLMSFMFATATEFVPLASLPEVTIAIDHDSGHQKQLASVLAEALYSAGYQNIRIVSLRKFREYHARLEAVVALFDIENAILSRIDDTTYQSLKCLLLSSSKVLWVSKGGYPQADPSHGMIDGFAKVFRIENINVKFTTLRLEEISENMLQNLSLITSALKYLIDAGELDSPEDYIVKDGMLHVSRIYEDLTLKAKITEMSSGERKVVKRLGNTRPFTLTTKDWANPRIESITDGVSVLETLADDEVEIEVQAIGLHSVDSSIMSGNISTLSMGRECAGFVTKIGKQCPFILGDRVCAYSNTTANSTCRTKGRFAIRITRSLSFEEASTLPQDYLVANYLVREARLGDEDVVVIRGGQTRIGRALLYILGASSSKIFATVATKEEETLIRTVFTHVQFSTDCCFSEKFYEWSNTGANVMFDVMYTNPKQLTECVYKFGQVFSVRTGTEVTGGEPLSLRGINVSAGIAMTIVDIKEVLEYRLDELQMPLAVLHEHHAFPVKVVPLSNLKSMATYGRDLDSRERLSVTYDDQDEISVSGKRCISKVSFEANTFL